MTSRIFKIPHSFYKYVVILTVIAASTSPAYSNDIDQTLKNKFLYGPYLNAPIITVPTSNNWATLITTPCEESAIATVNEWVNSPGKKIPTLSDDQLQNIAICAAQFYEPSLPLMNHVVYPQLLSHQPVSGNHDIHNLVFHPDYIQTIAEKTPKILAAIPDSHPDYLRIIQHILPKNVDAFNHISLRYKRHPWVTNTLFNTKNTPDDLLKHLAIQYTTSADQRQSFVMTNGLLYLELPFEKRNNPYLAYHAYVQNDDVYPFIPTKIKDAFKEDGTIMIPRYMTKFILLKQALSRHWDRLWQPVIDALMGDVLTDDIRVSITSDDPNQDVPPSDPSISKQVFYPIPFKNERTVVTDIRIINKIEVKKNRRLLNLWRIARYGDHDSLDDGQVFVAMFQPIGKDYLGSIVIKYNGRYMFSDYAAVFSMDGESIWRIKDDGSFSSKTFSLDQIKKSPSGTWHFSFSWKGAYTTNVFNLVEEGSLLVKEFINYYFE